MKFFNLSDHYASPELISIINQFLDVDFISLSHQEKLEALKDLDNFIYRTTGQPKINIVLVENKQTTHKGRYFHNYDGSFDNEYMEIVYRNESELTGVYMLIVYLHEKFHQFQYRSVVEGNPEVDNNTRNIWMWCADYIDSSKDSAVNYLCNPIEGDAFKHQYNQVLALLNHFVDKRKTHRSVIKQLKKERTDVWITLDINMDYVSEIYDMIDRAKANFDPERIFGKTIKR